MGQGAKKVAVFTGARSEYGLLRWVIEEIRAREGLDLLLIVSGGHFLAETGETVREIEQDGFDIAARVPIRRIEPGVAGPACAVAEMIPGLSDAIRALAPDLVVFMGDRYELLALMTCCITMAVPLAHVSGGEVTEGAFDEQIRHAATKAAHLHFVANEIYARRVRQMGEEPWRVCVSGEPGIDNMHRLELGTADDLAKVSGLDFTRLTALVTYHPPTLDVGGVDGQMAEIVAALEAASARLGLQYLITYPGADPGADRIVDAWKRFVAERKDRVLIKSLGQRLYLRALKECALMIGNSSSGLVEVPSYNLPVVNIGDRQAGRERAANIVDCAVSADAIGQAIDRALAYDRSRPCINPYGDGNSARKIVDFIARTLAEKSRAEILAKKFCDLATA